MGLPPKEDDFLRWNDIKHWYELTDNAIENYYNIDVELELGDSVEKQVFLRQNSDVFHTWLYQRIRPEGVRTTEYRLATNFQPKDGGYEFFDAIKQCLLANAYYLLNYDGDLKNMDTQNIEDMVAPQARYIAKASKMATLQQWGTRVSDDDYRVGY